MAATWIQPWHKTLTQSNSIWLKLIHSESLMMAAILNSAILDSPILHKKNFTHSFWLNLMMAAILNSAIMDSAILHKKNFTHSFWLNLMMAAILKSAIMDSAYFAQKKTSLIHSDSTWWWQPSWTLLSWFQTLPSWIQTPCYLLSDSLKNTLTPLWLWLKLIKSDSNLIHSHLTWWWQPSWIQPSSIWPSWIQPCLVFPLKLTNTCQDWFPTICTKKTSLIHSDSSWWLQLSWNLPSSIQILPFCTKKLVTLKINSKTLFLHSDPDSN